MRNPVILGVIAAIAASPAVGEDTAKPARRIVVELFTSQGCSSCPPADRFLSELGKTDDVIPLSFHVDYWNDLGWRDPFSSFHWSRRQRQYAAVFGTNRAYTPMMVVDASVDFVGSHTGDIRDEISRRQATAYAAEVEVTARRKNGRIEVEIAVKPHDVLPRNLQALILTYEKDITTRVPRGENARRTLHHDYVVRRETAQAWKGAPIVRSLPIESDWDPEKLGIAVLLQHRDSLKIYGAATADLAR